jgi:CRP-like cAMP-binding protein
MKMNDVTQSHSGRLSTQADGFFSSFFSERKDNRSYLNDLQFYGARTEIIKQDMPANAVYLIEHGLVKLVRETQNGSRMIIGLRHRDWLIGAPTVLLDRSYNFTVIAVVPTVLRCILKKDFLDHIKRNEQFSWHIHQLLSQQVFDQMKRVESMGCLSAEIRLMRFLLDTVREIEPLQSGTPDNFTLPLTNQELAQLLMITPEHLCRVLKKLEQKGFIRHGNGSLIVAFPSGLSQATA